MCALSVCRFLLDIIFLRQRRFDMTGAPCDIMEQAPEYVDGNDVLIFFIMRTVVFLARSSDSL